MAVTLFKKSTSLNTKPATFTRLISDLWATLGNKLQHMHQNKKNRETYTLLLQNDDYLLRDIGVSREGIRALHGKTGQFDAGCELEKIRATAGRNLN